MPVTPPPRAKRQPTKIQYAPRAPQAPRIYRWGQTNPILAAGVKAQQPAYTPAVSQASAAPGFTGSATSSTGGDIRDPTYWLNLANIDEYYGNQKKQSDEITRQDKEALDRALTMLGYGKASYNGNALTKGGALQGSNFDASGTMNQGSYYQDIQNAKTAANKAGLFYSGQLGQNIGNINQSYEQKRGDLTSGYAGRQNLRDIASQSLETQYAPGGIKYKEAANAAADRAAANLINNPPAPTTWSAAQINAGLSPYTPTPGNKRSQTVKVAPGWSIVNGKLVYTG